MEDRGLAPNVLQPGMLGNGVFGTWLARLSDYSELTRLAVKAESPTTLVDDLYRRFLTRPPTPEEERAMVDLITPGFEEGLTRPAETYRTRIYVPETSEANRIAAETEARVAQGPPPTEALRPKWRERLEDVIWALVNSPEMQFIP